MANTNLKEAKAAKNDEFYTQFHDIEIEMNAYLEYDPDVFKGKTILLPCDAPEWSNFTRYFAAGMATLTQVIEAQSKLRSAETELLDAEINYNNSVSKYIAMRGI